MLNKHQADSVRNYANQTTSQESAALRGARKIADRKNRAYKGAAFPYRFAANQASLHLQNDTMPCKPATTLQRITGHGGY